MSQHANKVAAKDSSHSPYGCHMCVDQSSDRKQLSNSIQFNEVYFMLHNIIKERLGEKTLAGRGLEEQEKPGFYIDLSCPWIADPPELQSIWGTHVMRRHSQCVSNRVLLISKTANFRGKEKAAFTCDTACSRVNREAQWGQITNSKNALQAALFPVSPWVKSIWIQRRDDRLRHKQLKLLYRGKVFADWKYIKWLLQKKGRLWTLLKTECELKRSLS